MRKYFSALLFVLPLCFSIAFAVPAGAAPAADSLKIIIRYGDINQDKAINIYDLLDLLVQLSGLEPLTSFSDLNNNGKTDVFDLLAFLRNYALFSESPPEDFEVAASIGSRSLRLAQPRVNSFSSFNENNEVRDNYKIYSNREIEKVELIFAGDTLTQLEGLTPVFFAADPDTIKWLETPIPVSDSIAWKITVWDSQGNCAVDSGISRFTILMPDLTLDAGYVNTGNEIEFPLILKGAWQRFGIRLRNMTFDVDLNPEGRDSVVFEDISNLAEAVMEEILANDSLWHSTDIWGSHEPYLFISAAVSITTELKSDRLYFIHKAGGGFVEAICLDGNEKLMSLLGFPKWRRSIASIGNDQNYILDPDVYEHYKFR